MKADDLRIRSSLLQKSSGRFNTVAGRVADDQEYRLGHAARTPARDYSAARGRQVCLIRDDHHGDFHTQLHRDLQATFNASDSTTLTCEPARFKRLASGTSGPLS